MLYVAIALFLSLSIPISPNAPEPSIFAMTRSRLATPTDIIFKRLAEIRSYRRRGGAIGYVDPVKELTPADALLKSKFTSIAARKIYLRFGPDALTRCTFCSPDSGISYLLYYLPKNSLLPHLFHLAIIGIVTSARISGRQAAQWRSLFTMGSLVLLAIDFYIIAIYEPYSGKGTPKTGIQGPPMSLYNRITLLRPLVLSIFDGLCALVIYLSATNRVSLLSSDSASQPNQVEQLVSKATSNLVGGAAHLHSLDVIRTAVASDKGLRNKDDAYWQSIVDSDSASKKDEEIVQAMSLVSSGQGSLNMKTLNDNASEYARKITAGLEDSN